MCRIMPAGCAVELEEVEQQTQEIRVFGFRAFLSEDGLNKSDGSRRRVGSHMTAAGQVWRSRGRRN